jgi:hypothetical protein
VFVYLVVQVRDLRRRVRALERDVLRLDEQRRLSGLGDDSTFVTRDPH